MHAVECSELCNPIIATDKEEVLPVLTYCADETAVLDAGSLSEREVDEFRLALNQTRRLDLSMVLISNPHQAARAVSSNVVRLSKPV